jgi:hypothetical protein
MSRYRKSKTNTTFFLDIPSPKEIAEEKVIKKKYKEVCLLNGEIKFKPARKRRQR